MEEWRAYTQPVRRGTSHQQDGRLCQDAAAFQESDAVLAAAVADGLGQLEYSQVAAAAAAEAAVRVLCRYPDSDGLQIEELRRTLLDETRNAVRAAAEREDVALTELDCTLLLAAVWKNQSRCILGQLGDGAVCVFAEREARLLSVPNKMQSFPANATWTLCSEQAKDQFFLEFQATEGLTGVMLTSDGLEKELYSRVGGVKKKAAWYFNLISGEPKSKCEEQIGQRWDLLASDARYGFTDDMCLAALFRPGAVVSLPEDATWLCVCEHRNRLESTWCEHCGKDFLKMYRKADFSQYGGKFGFFTYMNAHPEEERLALEGESSPSGTAYSRFREATVSESGTEDGAFSGAAESFTPDEENLPSSWAGEVFKAETEDSFSSEKSENSRTEAENTPHSKEEAVPKQTFKSKKESARLSESTSESKPRSVHVRSVRKISRLRGVVCIIFAFLIGALYGVALVSMLIGSEHLSFACTIFAFLVGILCCAVSLGMWMGNMYQKLTRRIQNLERQNQQLRTEQNEILQKNQCLEAQNKRLQAQRSTIKEGL